MVGGYPGGTCYYYVRITQKTDEDEHVKDLVWPAPAWFEPGSSEASMAPAAPESAARVLTLEVDLEAEVATILNSGTSVIDLSGWTLLSVTGGAAVHHTAEHEASSGDVAISQMPAQLGRDFADNELPHGDRSVTCPELQFSRSSNWCSGQDSNLHALRHTHLKRVCLPIPPPERSAMGAVT